MRRHAWNHRPDGEQVCVKCGLHRRHVERRCDGWGLIRFLWVWEYGRDGIHWRWVNSRQPVPACKREEVRL